MDRGAAFWGLPPAATRTRHFPGPCPTSSPAVLPSSPLSLHAFELSLLKLYSLWSIPQILHILLTPTHFISPILENLFLNAASAALNASAGTPDPPPNHPPNHRKPTPSGSPSPTPLMALVWSPTLGCPHPSLPTPSSLVLSHREHFPNSCSHPPPETLDNTLHPQEEMLSFLVGEFCSE